MATADEVIVEFEAKVSGYERDVKRAANTFEKATGKQKRDIRNLENEMRKSTDSMRSQIKRLAGALAAGFSVRELARLSDSFTRLQNNLRVAGLEGQQLKGVQDQLFTVAQRYGVELESLSGVFLKASLAQQDLGVTTEQIIRLNEITAASLKITGSSAAEAQGALLQLGQALGSGVVRAEEFNSVIEGALPLAQAAARGMEGMGGSVAKLRAEIADGNVTSKQFFEAVLRGGVTTLEDAEKATLTLSGGMTALTNALTVYIGEADKANGISAALGEALGALAENLDVIIPALAVIAVALGGRLVAGALGGSAALRAVSAHASIATTSLAGTALAARSAGTALLAAFGGPVGLAITAITLAVGYFASESASAEVEATRLAAAADANFEAFSRLERQTGETGKEMDQLATDEAAAAAAAVGLRIDTDKLADAHYRAAVAARVQRIEEQKLALQLSAKAALKVYNGRLAEAKGLGSPGSTGGYLGLGGNTREQLTTTARDRRLQALTDIRASPEWKEYQRRRSTLDAMLAAEIEIPPAPTVSSGGDDKPSRKARTRSGKDLQREAERLAQERLDALEAQIDILRGLTDADLNMEAEIAQANAKAARTVDDRADFLVEALQIEREQRYRALDAEFTERERRVAELKGLTDAEKDQLRQELKDRKQAAEKNLEKLYGSRPGQGGVGPNGEVIVESNARGLLFDEQMREYERELQDQLRADLRTRADTLNDLAGIALATEDRHKLQQAALAIEQQIQQSLLEQAIANGEIADADRARADLALRQGTERENQRRDQMGPLEAYQFGLESKAANLNSALEQLGVDTIKSFNAELTDAIVNFTSLGDVGLAVLKGLTASMVELALQQLTMRAISATVGSAATAATTAQAAAAASAWAPAAAAASLATLGANAGPAAAALASTNALASALAASGGGFADGGQITGAGGPREDKVLIAASPQEYMIQAWAAKRLGKSTLDYINATGRLPGFASGGLIGQMALPSGSPAMSSGGSSSGADLALRNELKGVLADAVRAMPPINLYPTLDPANALRSALATPGGRKAMFDFVSDNSRAFRSAGG